MVIITGKIMYYSLFQFILFVYFCSYSIWGTGLIILSSITFCYLGFWLFCLQYYATEWDKYMSVWGYYVLTALFLMEKGPNQFVLNYILSSRLLISLSSIAYIQMQQICVLMTHYVYKKDKCFNWFISKNFKIRPVHWREEEREEKSALQEGKRKERKKRKKERKKKRNTQNSLAFWSWRMR